MPRIVDTLAAAIEKHTLPRRYISDNTGEREVDRKAYLIPPVEVKSAASASEESQ